MAKGKFGGGDGSEKNPFLVEDVYDLKAINDKNKEGYFHYKQTENITMTEIWEPICSSYYDSDAQVYEDNKFKGYYDGDYCSIIDMTINSTKQNASFISYAEGTTLDKVIIKNIKFKNPKIELNNHSTVSSVGVVFGSVSDAIIENIMIENFIVNIDGNTRVHDVGNIVGSAMNVEFNKCESIGFEYHLAHSNDAHGFCASRDSVIENCLVQGIIQYVGNASSRASVFSRTDECNIKNCLAIVSILGRVSNGNSFSDPTDFFGNTINSFPTIVTESYFNKDDLTDYSWEVGVTYEASVNRMARDTIVKGLDGEFYNLIGKPNSTNFSNIQPGNLGLKVQPPLGESYAEYWAVLDYREGRTTSQLKDQSNYTDWDFEKVWKKKENEYPRLRFEPPRKTITCKRVPLNNYRR